MVKKLLIFGIVFLLIAVFFTIIYLNFFHSFNKKNEIENPLTAFQDQQLATQQSTSNGTTPPNTENDESQNEEIVIDESYISYILNELGAFKLSNPPLSSDTPKIETQVGELIFNSEIVNGNIITEKGYVENEDIRIITTREEVINALQSTNLKIYIQGSVASGKTTLVLISSYKTLFYKGYLNLYKDITGQSFTGAIIRGIK